MKADTKNSYIFPLAAIFKFAVAEYKIENQMGAFRAYKDDVRPREKKHPFLIEHLKVIFDASTYPNRSHSARFWLPLRALWTGARRGELVQLLASDVQVIDGIDVLSITDEGEGQSVKTESAIRIVPIHDQLKELEFLRFVESVRQRGADARLFEQLYTAKNPGDAYGKSFAYRLRHQLGITNAKLTFHSFRHSAEQALSNADVAEKRIDELLGWSGKRGMQSRYGGNFPASLLAEAINKVRYDGLDLNPLCKIRRQ